MAIAEEEFVPTDSGGRVETVNMLRALSAAGLRLTVVIPGLTAAGAPVHQAALPGSSIQGIPRRTGWRSHLSRSPFLFASRPQPPDLVERLRVSATHPFEAVLAVSFRVAHLGQAVASGLGVPLVIRPHNYESQYFSEIARTTPLPKSLAYRLEALKLRRAETRLHNSAGVALFADIGRDDAKRRSMLTATPVIHVPPFVPPVTHLSSEARANGSEGRNLLFVGSLDSAHNVSALDWFVTSCWPRLRDALPETRFQVVGRRGPAKLLTALAAAGVRVTADAPDVAPHLASADVFINPVRQGAGVNIKLVEAMAAGLPVVTTRTGARGMTWQHGEQLLIADEPEAFSAAVIALLLDPALRERIGRAGQEFVRTELDGSVQVARMRAFVRAAR